MFYTAPTAIRAFMKWGTSGPPNTIFRRCGFLGTVGEPINPEAWMWYHELIGDGRCPIVDTWWQTETGAILISPLPGVTRPSRAPRRGRSPESARRSVTTKTTGVGRGGLLVIAQARGRRCCGSPTIPIASCDLLVPMGPLPYFTGDGATRDDDATSGSSDVSMT